MGCLSCKQIHREDQASCHLITASPLPRWNKICGNDSSWHGCHQDCCACFYPNQVPVIAFDQRLFAVAKQVQLNWPNIHGKYHFVLMFGGLHIEMSALRLLGDLLQGSGWTSVLIQAPLATSGTAESFIKVSQYPYKTYSPGDCVCAVHPFGLHT